MMPDVRLERTESNSNELWQKYREMARIMSILCNRTAGWYNLWKQIVMIPLIILSSSLAVLNGSFQDNNGMRIVNIVCNSITAVLIGINSQLRISEKASMYYDLASKFSKLEHSIEQNVSLRDVSSDKLNNFIQTYDTLMESVNGVPEFIKRNMGSVLSKHRYIPYILGGYSNHPSQTDLGAVSGTA